MENFKFFFEFVKEKKKFSKDDLKIIFVFQLILEKTEFSEGENKNTENYMISSDLIDYIHKNFIENNKEIENLNKDFNINDIYENIILIKENFKEKFYFKTDKNTELSNGVNDIEKTLNFSEQSYNDKNSCIRYIINFFDSLQEHRENLNNKKEFLLNKKDFFSETKNVN